MLESLLCGLMHSFPEKSPLELMQHYVLNMPGIANKLSWEKVISIADRAC
jgi:hypothetical protein